MRLLPSSDSRRLPVGLVVLGLGLLSSGCVPTSTLEASKRRAQEAAEERAEREKEGSILRKTTQDIKKYDPDAGREVSDLKVRATSPILYPLEAYGPIVGQISTLQIDQLVTMYNIEHNKYPTYEEFMKDIVKANNVQLPVLPAKAEYHYDEANHKLVVLAYEPPDKDAKKDGAKEGAPKEGTSKITIPNLPVPGGAEKGGQ